MQKQDGGAPKPNSPFSGVFIDEPGKDDQTPLFAACAKGSLEVSALLLKAGADPNFKRKTVCVPTPPPPFTSAPSQTQQNANSVTEGGEARADCVVWVGCGSPPCERDEPMGQVDVFAGSLACTLVGALPRACGRAAVPARCRGHCQTAFEHRKKKGFCQCSVHATDQTGHGRG